MTSSKPTPMRNALLIEFEDCDEDGDDDVHPAAGGAVGTTSIYAGSRAPVEFVDRARVAIPTPQLGISPPASLTARDFHVRTLKRCLRCGPLDRHRTPLFIPQRLERRLLDVSHPNRHVPVSGDVDLGRLGRQPPANDRTEEPLEEPTLAATEHCFQLAALVGAGSTVDIKPSRTIAAEEIAGPLGSQDDLPSANIDALDRAPVDVEP